MLKRGCSETIWVHDEPCTLSEDPGERRVSICLRGFLGLFLVLSLLCFAFAFLSV